MEHTILSQNIGRLMAELGKSKTDLSYDARLAYSNIDSILRGKTYDPRVSTLKSIAGALGVTVNDLIYPVDQQLSA